MNELRLPVIAFGTGKAGQGFNADPHLQARFSQLTLPLWKADNTLANFLAAYERLLPLEKASNLASRDKVAFLAKTGEGVLRSEEHTSALQSLMRISYADFSMKKNNNIT